MTVNTDNFNARANDAIDLSDRPDDAGRSLLSDVDLFKVPQSDRDTSAAAFLPGLELVMGPSAGNESGEKTAAGTDKNPGKEPEVSSGVLAQLLLSRLNDGQVRTMHDRLTAMSQHHKAGDEYVKDVNRALFKAQKADDPGVSPWQLRVDGKGGYHFKRGAGDGGPLHSTTAFGDLGSKSDTPPCRTFTNPAGATVKTKIPFQLAEPKYQRPERK